MIDWDWTFLGSVNAWQTIVTISVAIIALFIITRMLMKFWPWLGKVMVLFDALGKLPKFMTITTEQLDQVHHETHQNDGSSLKDAVNRIEMGVKGLYQRADAADLADAALRKEIEDTRPHT